MCLFKTSRITFSCVEFLARLPHMFVFICCSVLTQHDLTWVSIIVSSDTYLGGAIVWEMW